MDLLEAVYEVARTLPAEERYGLASQMRRSVASIPANVAEGYGRSHTRDFLRHLYIARGSLAETETYILACERLQYTEDRDACGAWECAQVTGRLLNGLIRSLERRLSTDGPRSPVTDHRSLE
jgi:four helix bundle protein